MDVLKTAMFNRNCNFPSKVENMRSHGWQLPLHPLQIVGMAVYSFLVVAFYAFLGPFIGNRIVELTVVSVFSFVVISVIFLFIRCTATDPTDKTSLKKKRRAKTCGFSNMNYRFLLGQIVVRFLRKVERKILKCFIRRKYLDPWKTTVQMETLLFFPLVAKDDAVTPGLQDDISFCSLCDFEVKKHSKHCRTCNRCVEGFDHHCRWLNNCIGKKNYTTFILLMVSVLLTLVIEGGTAIVIFIRCFADGKGIEQELERKLHIEFPRGVLAAISVFLVLMTAYSLAALGQLFFFHVVLIRKGMRTYDYILAMKEENQAIEAELYNDFDSSSDDSSEFDSPEKPTLVSRFICRGGHQAVQNPKKLSIRIEGEPESSNLIKKPGFRASIDPWKLIKMSREKALIAAERARERLVKQKPMLEEESLKPLPLETKCGPLMNRERNTASTASGTTPLISKGWFPGSPGRFSSPRRRISGSPTMFSGVVVSPKQTYRSSFDLKLTDVSRELETYISKQVLCSALKKDGVESPR